MIGKLLGLAPWWVWLLAAGALLAIGAGGGFTAGRYVGAVELAHEQRDRATERAQWADERTRAAQRASEALRLEIEAHNALQTELEAIHARSQDERAAAAAQAASAAAALAAAGRSAGRLRDAIATSRLAARAALDAAGAAGQCEAAQQAADLLRDMLARTDELAGRIGTAAVQTGQFADQSWIAGRACESAYDAVRARSSP